jgi:hypothetical protein
MTRTIWWCDVTLRTAKLSAVMWLLAAIGCVDRQPHEKQIDPAYIKQNLLPTPPAAIQNRVDADLGGYVTYLGNDVESTSLAPGASAKVVHYWKVVSPPGSEWRVFSHLVGTGDQWLNIDRTDMRSGYPPAEWKAGDVIRDEQKFTLPADWKSPYAQLTIGLYRKGGHGPEDRMRIEKGPADAESRVLAVRFPIDRGGSRAQPAPYLVRRATGPVTVDGAASEADWQGAPSSPPFATAEGGREVVGAARARLLWDDAYLYAFIQVEDPDVHSQYTGQDDPLWKEDVVELFIDADRNRRGYVELQVNPRNAHFDSWFPQTRAQSGHPEWNSSMKSAVVVRGTLDDGADQDQGWDAEIAIPLADVKGMDAAMKVATPPALGDRWRLNVVRVDKPAKQSLTASSWNAIPLADFHALGRMLTVVFADPQGAVPAAAEGTPPGQATGDKPTDDKPAGDKPTDDKAAGDKPTDDKAAGDKLTDDKAAGGKPTGDKAAGATDEPDGKKAAPAGKPASTDEKAAPKGVKKSPGAETVPSTATGQR